MAPDATEITKGLVSLFAGSRQQLRLGLQAGGRRVTSSPLVAHHGIQRSGTNYLRELLRQSGSFVVNGVDHARNDPRHKHFRWQADKSSIVMDHQYLTTTVADNISEVNAAARYPHLVRHVVIFKQPARWLDSIVRWGVACGWTASSADFWADPHLPTSWLREWSEYYSQWGAFAEGAPDQVVLLAYEDLVRAPNLAIERTFERFGWGAPKPLDNDGRIEQVACSSPRAMSDHAVPTASPEATEAVRQSELWDYSAHVLIES